MDYSHELGAATGRFAEFARQGQGTEQVPSCEGWTLDDLAKHLGSVHRWAAAIVLGGQRITMPSPLVQGPVATWYTGTAVALLAALKSVSPEEVVPNFTRMNETAEFWPRRQMHETIVHGVDAAQALGLPESAWGITPALAADGVDEVFQVFFPRLTAGGARPDVQARIRLQATDIDESWIIAPGSDETATPIQIHPSMEAEATVTGTASDLYLGLWHRVGHDRLELDGGAAKALFAGPTTP